MTHLSLLNIFKRVKWVVMDTRHSLAKIACGSTILLSTSPKLIYCWWVHWYIKPGPCTRLYLGVPNEVMIMIIVFYFLYSTIYNKMTEFPLVLIVKGPWDPYMQFQRVGGSFCSSWVLCLFTKIFGIFFLHPTSPKKLCVLFIFFCLYKKHTCALMETLDDL